MEKLFKKLFLLICLAFIFAAPVLASPTNPTAQENAAAKDDYEENGVVTSPVHVANVTANNLWSINCWLGYSEACSAKADNKNSYLQNSVLGQVNGAIAGLYLNKPAGTGTFIAYYAEKIGVMKPAYAQTPGIGFAGLRPLMNLWIAFRNIAYAFLILVMVVIGFMILFRTKIDPRTVISIQNSIPRIIITLFLITFSYAIVGLMIDFMYLCIFFAIAVLKQATPLQGDLNEIAKNYMGGSVMNLGGAVFSTGMKSVKDITTILGGGTGSVITTIIATVTGAIMAAQSGIKAVIIVGSAIGGTGIASSISGNNPILLLLVMLALVFTIIRIFLMLLNAYVGVILSLIFGPLQIMLGAIPNSNAFSNWFRNLLANLAVFPITVIMLCLGSILSAVAYNNGTGGLWTPPGLSGENIAGGISGLIGLGILFAVPTIAGALKELLKSKPLIPTGTGAVMAPITSVYQTATQGLSQIYYLKGMFPKKP